MRSIPLHFRILGLVAGLIAAIAPVRSADGSAIRSNSVRAVTALVSGERPAASYVRVKSESAEAADRALETLVTSVRMQSHPKALHSAFEAFYNYRDSHPAEVVKPYLYFVDFGLPASEPRGYVFDMDALRVVEGPFTVAHGRGSVSGNAPIPTLFSNRPGSYATSLGLFLTQETYTFSGKSGGQAYRSVGLRMQGLSGLFNSKARERGVVIHGAPYVTADKAGRSEGCPAMEPDRAERLLPLLGGGALVFLFSPLDHEWLRFEPWTRDELAYVWRPIPEGAKIVGADAPLANSGS